MVNSDHTMNKKYTREQLHRYRTIQGVPQKTGTRINNYVFAEIIIYNNVIIIDNSL